MKYVKYIFLFSNFLILHFTASAQKQSFDIASFTMPDGWTEQKTDGHVSYSRIDNGSWAQITIYKSTSSSGAVDIDFDKDWKELVAVNKDITTPEKTNPQSADGWMIQSGNGTWEYNGARVKSLLTVYSNEQVYLSVLCNTTATTFLKDYQTLLASLKLKAENTQVSAGNNNETQSPGSSEAALTNAIPGLWITNEAETNGFMNGFLLYSGGYMRKEYLFREDGTYTFRTKNWLAANDNIYFACESGRWIANGNQLSLTPAKGRAGWWNKDRKSNDVNKWGSFQKAAAYKLETATYSIEIKVDPNYSNAIILHTVKPTERDGGQFNNPPYRFVYVHKDESLIDNPPGFSF